MIQRLLLPALLLSLLARPLMADRVADSSSGRVPEAGDLVLFPLDDVSLPWRDNLKLTLQRPAKYAANPVMSAGPIEGPDGYGTLLYGTVIKDGGKFGMWYVASPRADPKFPEDYAKVFHNGYRPIAYAESTDGIHWTKPDLGLVTFRGNRHNNLVAIDPAQEPYAIPYDFIAVLKDSADPDPARRYKMAYITRDPVHPAASTATAVSPDGRSWTLVNTIMFTKGNFENTSLVRFDGLYYLTGQDFAPYDGGLADGSPAGRVMKAFFSPDFRHWSNGRALSFNRTDYTPAKTSFGQENHMGAGLWNRGNVILGFYGRWHGDTISRDPRQPHSPLRGLKIDLGLVVSNDAIHYREPVRNFVMVPLGPSDSWESNGLLQSNGFANTATETLIWYSHWYTSRPNEIPPLPETLSPEMQHKADSIGLLRLPRDRFGYFSKLLAISEERNPSANAPRDASCLSRSLTLTASSRLAVNVDDVTPDAPLQIALVDDAERPLPGYTAQLTAGGLKVPVAWADGHAALPVKTPFRVKITWPVGVDNAKLYAVYIEHD